MKGLTSKGSYSHSKKSTSTNHIECYLAARARALEKPSRPRETDLTPNRHNQNTRSQLHPISPAAPCHTPACGKSDLNLARKQGEESQLSIPLRAEHGGRSSALLPVQCRHPPCMEAPDPKELPDTSHGAAIQNLTCKG